MSTTEIPKQIHTERLIGKRGNGKGACCIFFGGIHGNEPTGVLALQEVLAEIDEKDLPLQGSFYAIAGNIPALANGDRYTSQDLNRLWTEKRMRKMEAGIFSAETEDEQQLIELFELVNQLNEKEEGPFYLFDLHTTSSKTNPFITVNDSLLNRKFTEQYPVPLILGIEEYLDGPMLSYYNEKGYVSFGFEGGEHHSRDAIDNHKAFTYLSLVFTGIIEKETITYDHYYQRLESSGKGMSHFYEIYKRFGIGKDDQFKMEPGFENFQKVWKDQIIAEYNGEELEMEEDSIIFMPLYQATGEDGFFLIQKTPEFFLKLSTLMRYLRIDKILPILPGVIWMSKRKEKMLVDLKIARFLTKPFLHLMGYRAKQMNEEALIIKNREALSRKEDYKNEYWY